MVAFFNGENGCVDTLKGPARLIKKKWAALQCKRGNKPVQMRHRDIERDMPSKG